MLALAWRLLRRRLRARRGHLRRPHDAPPSAPNCRRFVSNERPVLGVCNGFQILVELGLLPAFEDVMTRTARGRAVHERLGPLRVPPHAAQAREPRASAPSPMHIGKGSVVMIPCAHAEGKLMFRPRTRRTACCGWRRTTRWCSATSTPTATYAGYPWCPNGSHLEHRRHLQPGRERAGHDASPGEGRVTATPIPTGPAPATTLRERAMAEPYSESVVDHVREEGSDQSRLIRISTTSPSLQPERAAQVVLAQDLHDVLVVRARRHDHGALDVLDGGLDGTPRPRRCVRCARSP